MKFPERYRLQNHSAQWSSQTGDPYGAFTIPGPCSTDLRVIASDATDEVPWEHVSVSTHNRTPNWREMCYVKDLFWEEEQAVVQFHPPKSEWINNHPYCLHLWRPTHVDIPRPPSVTVGYKELNV